MAVFSIIQKTQLEGAKRLDSEYYQPEYLEIVQKIQSVPHTSLDSYAEKVFSGPFGSTLKSESYQDVGVPFIRISDISDLFIETDGLVFISPSEHKRIFSTHLGIGDIVLSKIGTVGRLSVISKELGEVNISENNIGIRLSNLPEEKKIALLFLLLGKYGQKQLLRKASGNIQLKLNVSDVESIQVPVFNDAMLRALKNLYTDFLSKRNEGDSFYAEAEDLLLEELGLGNFKVDEDLYSVINFSDIRAASRMDAEYFQPKYEKIFAALKKGKTDILENHFSVVKSKNFNYVDKKEVTVLKTKQLGKRHLNYKAENTTKEETVNQLKLPQLQDRDVLFAAMGVGSLGKVNVHYKDFSPKKKFTIDSTLRILRKKDDGQILSEVLTIFLRSSIGQELIYKYIVGSSGIISIYDDYTKKLVVPILPEKIQKKIAELVRASHAARVKAKQLLEDAKKKVEELIETKSK